MLSRFRTIAGTLAFGASLVAAPATAFVAFETGQVRPLALSPDGTRLFACNTPDNRLEIFDVGVGGLTHLASVPVGLEPLAVAARTNDEVWVVNHLSDSVSIVDVSDVASPVVTRTLNVGDEPRDIVFGGPAFDRAFVTTAHRGQNSPIDPQLTTAGVGRADVWVFDANDLGSSFGGDEEAVITLFGDTPRPLAVSPDGSRVYAGVFHSGNQTTVLSEGVIPNGGEAMGGLPSPTTNHSGVPAPEVGLIVKYDGSAWRDELGRDWSSFVRFNLPDYDVFAIDATQDPPAQVAGTAGRFPHVGTILFNMAVNPADGDVYVSNLESFNEVRFEGPGEFASTTVRSHLVESRITIIDPVSETVTPRHLNKHIDYDSCCEAIPNDTNDRSLAFPLEMAFSADGSELFVTAFGSSKIGVYDTAELAGDTFVPDDADHFEVSGGGPTGIVLDEDDSRLFVLTRFDNSVSVVSTATGMETQHVALHNPEPETLVAGRPFLYDARLSSSNGDQACASCHIFGDFDSLAWDLGDPDEEMLNNPSTFVIGPFGDPDFHPMKGPMTTQSLRGMDNHGPMHWRGDRTGGNDDPFNVQPHRGIYNENAAFNAFNGAFVGLLGRHERLTTEQMQSFTDFILQVMYPPNPIRALDNSLNADESAANGVYFSRQIDTLETCDGCHVLDRQGNAFGNVPRPGFFGTDGQSSFENETQHMKIAHLRNMYQKVGMFGNAAINFVNPGDNGHKGDQIRGFGFLHDGSMDTLFRFFQATVFNPTPGNVGFLSNTERRQMEALMMAFDTNHRPIVGQQVTLSDTSGGDADARVDLLLDRADADECDVVVKGLVAGEPRGWVYEGSGQFSSDISAEGLVTEAALRALADTVGQPLTFTAVPTGEGVRIGVDRDLDGYRDIDEAVTPCSVTTAAFVYDKASLADSKGRVTLKAVVPLASPYAGGTIALSAEDGGGTIFDGNAPGVAFSVNGAGTSWKFKAPSRSTGVTKVSIKAVGTTGDYKVSIRASQAWTPPAADETAGTTSVILNLAGECFDGPATDVR